VLKFSKACLLLVTFRLTIAFPSVAETHPDERLRLVISVYNDADVPATVLVQAEQEAAKIFDRAGLEVIWQNCSPSPNHVGPDALVRAGESSSPESEPASNPAGLHPFGWAGAPAPTSFDLENSDCATIEWPSHLAVRVVPRSRRWINEVFGVAFLSADGAGCYSDVFYEPAMELHTSWNVGLPDILGTVITHELGHLLLGSNSHASTGIMRAHWQGEELRRLSRSGLWFTNEQADRMSRRLRVIRQERSTQLAAWTRSAF
jgi:hypothetical protein